MFNSTPQGQNSYRWWADWLPTPAGQQWVFNKQWEARRIVDGMINQWGLQTLQSGEGVIDIGGDPGFVAAELLRSGIRVTVVDPAFGVSGKQDAVTAEFLSNFDQQQLRLIRQPFNQAFVDDPQYSKLLHQASALVSLYPDEATDNCLFFSAQLALRTALIPCNECAQYFPPHNPTYDGFVNQLMELDLKYSRMFGNTPVVRERICNTPFCQVILQRTPSQADKPRLGRAQLALPSSIDRNGCIGTVNGNGRRGQGVAATDMPSQDGALCPGCGESSCACSAQPNPGAPAIVGGASLAGRLDGAVM